MTANRPNIPKKPVFFGWMKLPKRGLRYEHEQMVSKTTTRRAWKSNSADIPQLGEGLNVHEAGSVDHLEPMPHPGAQNLILSQNGYG
eukprot:CAMPEP_0113820314 /NCGR_PEP_ID=MMETSP0328-20130328/1178_1 /TAXON_ID=39455 /ORGANISM="Alexandrium minutum" /LENGTH=86 /DNA_ID=CAMNT_0000788249 /DNA_START=338 /DNA_END=594 /DNA_ORIENTATION=- /assembly_acc=CAM_ASM_000350